MVKWLFNRYKKRFITLAFSDQEAKKMMVDYVFKGQRKDTDRFAGWEVAFIDSNGLRYYVPAHELTTPIMRLGVFSRYIDFLNTCISPAELTAVLDAYDNAIANVKIHANFSGLAKLQVITDQAREYLSHPIHAELFFRIACAFYVREDEDPAEYDFGIEEEKYQQLKKDSKDGLYDFFYRTPLKKLFDLYAITEENLTLYLKDSEQRAKEMAAVLQSAASFSAPTISTATAKNRRVI